MNEPQIPNLVTEAKTFAPEVFNAYVDGFNLYKGLLQRNPAIKWLDLQSFCQSLRPDLRLGKIYYFTALVKQLFPGDEAPNRQHAYLRVLENQGIKVVRGKFRKDESWKHLVSINRQKVIEPVLGNYLGIVQRALNKSRNQARPRLPMAHVLKMEEKGSDVNLASYLLRDSFRGLKNSLVISGDSDLVTPINFARGFGADVRVIVPNSDIKCSALRSAASSLIQLRPSDLFPFQLPDVFVTSKGRSIKKPSSWA